MGHSKYQAIQEGIVQTREVKDAPAYIEIYIEGEHLRAVFKVHKDGWHKFKREDIKEHDGICTL